MVNQKPAHPIEKVQDRNATQAQSKRNEERNDKQDDRKDDRDDTKADRKDSKS